MLIAAAVLQLVGAALFFVTGAAQVAMALLDDSGHARPLLALGGIGAAIASGYVVVSIFLLRRRRWAWVASLALDGLSALSLLCIPFAGGRGRVGLGELIILGPLFGLPLLVTIGLLIGSRRAVFAVQPKTAAEPLVVTPRDG